MDGNYGAGVEIQREKPRVVLPLVLFLITALTTTAAGAFYAGVNPFKDPSGFKKGLPFSLSLLFILGTHELGHFFASKRHRVATTLPHFIPVPPIPPLIGTFGAVIKMKSPITTKKALVDIGASGPLTGFISAVIVIFIGLRFSSVLPLIPAGEERLGLGSSIIFEFFSYLRFGKIPEGYDLYLHSSAFAGWIGLFVTCINLLPVGQLDGGHIVYALFGPFVHRIVSFSVVFGLVLLGIYRWQGWLVWAALVTIIGMWHPPVKDEYIPLDRKRVIISVLTLIVFVLTFLPAPFYIF